MNRSQALAERHRLRNLLAAYEEDRAAREDQNQRSDMGRELTPDRAAKVRARIAGLDQIIENNGN